MAKGLVIGLLASGAGIGIHPAGASVESVVQSQSLAGASDKPLSRADRPMTPREVRRLDRRATLEEVVTEIPAPDGTVVTVGIVADEEGNLPPDLEEEVIAVLDDLLDGQSRVEETVIEEVREDALEGLTFTATLEQEEPAVEETTEKAAMAQELAAKKACGSHWWPGQVYTISEPSPYYERSRYTRIEFSWGPAKMADLQSCDNNNITFEPDFVTYNYDGSAYHAKDIQAWSTNMPDGYKDTQFLDGDNERVYTVGTSRANKLVASTTYFTHFRTYNGNAAGDTAKINFQRGHRTPPTCDSTWCIFSDVGRRVPIDGWFPIPAAHAYTP